MDTEKIKAHLNLFAVLQNLEMLPLLDTETAQRIRSWDISLQFLVKNGPEAWLDFKGGSCTHGSGLHRNPSVKLFFLSCAHLNKMFDGKGMPIPLKGFSKLGFLSKEFSALTDRLEYFLKPEKVAEPSENYLKINAALSLYTGYSAVSELAQLEPTCQKLAAATPPGVLAVEVLPEGPFITLELAPEGIEVSKTKAASSDATMRFRNWEVASNLLTGKVDPYQAVALEDLKLSGFLPLIDNINLIIDRVEGFLK